MHTRNSNHFISILTTASALGGALLFSSVALAGNYEVCVDIQVQNNDSENTTPTGITEDYWLTDSQQTFPARGFYVQVINGSGTLASGYSNSDTGCFAFTVSGTSTYSGSQVLVHSVAKHGTTYVRVHDGGSSTASASPGSNLTPIAFNNKTFAPDVTVDVTVPLSGNWNALATASYALWRVRTGLDGKTISIGFDNAVSSTNYGNAMNYVEDDAYLIRINNGTWDARYRKFEIAHEMGHAAARLNHGVDGVENTFDDEYDYDGGINIFGCEQASSYNLRTAEYDSMGFKEGFAHLYAARVFNDKVSDAALSILGWTISMESYTGDTPVPTGGHYGNECVLEDEGIHGISTCEDWARFLWDIYTIPTATCSPSNIGLDEMYDIYSATRAMNPTAVGAWHTDIMDAVDANGTLSSCEKTQAGSFANWNLIGGVPHTY